MVESDWDFKKLPTHLLSDLKTTTTTNSHQLIPSTSTLNSFNSLHSIPSNHLILSSSSSSASSSSTPDSNPIDRLPNELLLEIFRALPSLDHSNDLLSPPLVSRKWRGPAQIVWVFFFFFAWTDLNRFSDWSFHFMGEWVIWDDEAYGNTFDCLMWNVSQPLLMLLNWDRI